MRGKNATYLVIALLLLAPALAAESFELELIPVEDHISQSGTAVFDVRLINRLDQEDQYTISVQQVDYVLFVEDGLPGIEAGRVGSYRIEISPTGSVLPGTKLVPIRVKSQQSQEFEDASAIVFIQAPGGAGTYAPSISLTVDAPQEVDPREGLTLNVQLRNRNARDYDREDPVTVIIQSDIFRNEYNTNLGPVGADGERAAERRIQLDPFEAPGDHPLQIDVLAEGQVVTTQTKTFTVLPYSEIEVVPFTEESLLGNFFKRTTTYKLRNDGNVKSTSRVTQPVSVLKQPFIWSNTAFTVEREDDQRVIVFSDELEPLEEKTVTVTENYRLLILLFVLVLISIVCYYLLRSPVLLAKEATLRGTANEGVNEIKVRLFIRNRSAKELRNLRVIDKISGIADVVEKHSLGTVKPTKVVKKQGQGTLVRWDLDQLEPFEERIITYTAKMSLKLVGDITLPNMKVKYDLPSGRERTAHSNEVVISKNE